MSKDIEISEMYYFKHPINGKDTPCFPVKSKNIDGVEHIGVIQQSDLDVFWVPHDEILRPVNDDQVLDKE